MLSGGSVPRITWDSVYLSGVRRLLLELLGTLHGCCTGAGVLCCFPDAHALGKAGQDALVFVLVDGLALIALLLLGLGDALLLAAYAVVVILPCNCSEHVQEHVIDGCQYPGGEGVGVGAGLLQELVGGG